MARKVGTTGLLPGFCGRRGWWATEVLAAEYAANGPAHCGVKVAHDEVPAPTAEGTRPEIRPLLSNPEDRRVSEQRQTSSLFLAISTPINEGWYTNLKFEGRPKFSKQFYWITPDRKADNDALRRALGGPTRE